jgi:hypothetical protein
VAAAILDAAETPTRNKKVGGMSKITTAISKLAPKLGDKMAAKQAGRQQYDEKPRHSEGTLHKSGEVLGVVGQIHGSGGREQK